MELVGQRPADVAGVRQDRPEIETDALEDTRIGLVHAGVGLFQRALIEMEGVGVLH